MEVKTSQGGLATIVGKVYILESEITVASRQLAGPLLVNDRRLLLEQFEHMLRVDHRRLNQAVESAKEVEGALKLSHENDERNKLSVSKLTSSDLVSCNETGRQKSDHKDHVLRDVHDVQ